MRPKLTYANVVSTACLFITLGGGAYAASRLPPDSVASAQVRDGSLRERDRGFRNERVRVRVKVETVGLNTGGPEPGHPGDVVTFDNALLDDDGTKIGRLQGYCVRVSEGSSTTCVESFGLPRGEVHIVGTTGIGSRRAVVIGGTGPYRDASGTIAPGERTEDGAIVNTLRLRVPR